jgi:benzoyl-CoA reductase/2-hydroxyglutaryl-CoA dehydratase subunit BcrC/BadD/HgdB
MKTVAFNSPFVPAEWIAAHGLRPQWLHLRAAESGRLSPVRRGVCPYVAVLMGAANAAMDASALVLTTVCDQMRYAAAVLDTQGSLPLFLMNVPSTWQTAASRQLYREEVQRLGKFLVRLGGHAPNGAELCQTMLEHEQERHELVAQHCSDNDATELRLAIVGGPLLDGDQALFDIVEHAGGRIVLDATEGSQRTLPRRFDSARIASSPLQELADAYFDGIPDAFRRPNNRLYEWLGRQLLQRRVHAVLFRRYLWCDLWHAELHRLRQWSELPVLEIDVGSDDLSASNRLQGRLEAFLEALR